MIMGRDVKVHPGSEKHYPSKLTGKVTVRCRKCKRSGLTSARFVGRSKWIDACGECRREAGG